MLLVFLGGVGGLVDILIRCLIFDIRSNLIFSKVTALTHIKSTSSRISQPFYLHTCPPSPPQVPPAGSVPPLSGGGAQEGAPRPGRPGPAGGVRVAGLGPSEGEGGGRDPP